MRFLIPALWMALAAVLSAQAPSRSVVEAEYFWDTDPGQGSGTAFAAADGMLDECIEELLSNVPTTSLAPGLHTFNVRVKDPDNNWSSTFTTVIDVVASDACPPPSRELEEAEYFWDTDPGEGNGFFMPAVGGPVDETIEAFMPFVPTIHLSPGLHTFNVRSKDMDGNWSSVFTTVVEIRDQNACPPPTRQLADAEYFWDTDPGQGNGTAFPPSDAAIDETIEHLLANIPTTSLSHGLHTFNVRTQDLDGNWSAPFTTIVDVRAPCPAPQRALVQAEYFWDIDPGQGSGTPILATDGALDETIEALLAGGISTPGSGLHTLNVRIKDTNNSWSTPFTTVVDVRDPTPPPRVAEIVQAEYFWNADPGFGNGQTLMVSDGSWDEPVEDLVQLNINAPDRYGPNLFNVRARDADGHWSATFSTVVVVDYNTMIPFDADRDGDLLSELMEYFLGTNPKKWDPYTQYLSHGVVVEPSLGAAPRLTLTINREWIAPDVNYRAEMSNDLMNWYHDPTWVVPGANTGTQLQFYALDSIATDPKLFGRIELQFVP